MERPPAKKRVLVGTVISDKMQKTVVVRVDRLKKHPKYEQRYAASRGFKAHDEKNEFHVGDRVVIEETRPLSKGKRWQVIKKIDERSIASPESSPAEISENTENSQEDSGERNKSRGTADVQELPHS